MAPYLLRKYNVRVPFELQRRPCPTVKKEPAPCPYVALEDLIDLKLRSLEKKEQKPEKKKLPCEGVKPPSKKKFEQLGLKNICAMPYTRKWTLEENSSRDTNELPKWFGRQRWKQREKSSLQPRELDDYEKSLWAPICKPPEPPGPSCVEPVDVNLCVFCLQCFYTGGFIHDLFEKVPLIKKQSEILGDEIGQRIGIRTRITVHKKCYDAYVQDFANREQEEVDLTSEVEEESDDFCGEEEEQEEEEEEEDQTKEKKGGRRKKRGAPLFSNLNFCLKKFGVPTVDPGKTTR